MLLDDLMATGQVTAVVEPVRVDSITTDTRVNTRPVYGPWVAQRKDSFDPSKLGIPIVSERADGTRVWLDGQNRGALLKLVGWGDQSIDCKVFRGLTVKQEAALFLGHNDNRRVGTVYQFLARVTAGDPTAVAITEIARGIGWRIADQNGPETITAVAALEKVYQGDLREPVEGYAPGWALQRTLSTITDAWGFKSETPNGEIIKGVGALFNRYLDGIDSIALIKKLASYPAGPAGLLGDARGRRQYQGGSVSACVSESVVDLYNKGRRSRTLETWRR
jgi:hypothetical protein